nr:MAG TPA: hypothetical protein [Caudoviricetes sp.]
MCSSVNSTSHYIERRNNLKLTLGTLPSTKTSRGCWLIRRPETARL